MVLEAGGLKDTVTASSERFVLCHYMVESSKGTNKCTKKRDEIRGSLAL